MHEKKKVSLLGFLRKLHTLVYFFVKCPMLRIWVIKISHTLIFSDRVIIKKQNKTKQAKFCHVWSWLHIKIKIKFKINLRDE